MRLRYVHGCLCCVAFLLVCAILCCLLPREGFMKSIQLMLRVREGGLATAGPPCGSFIFLNMHTSGRSKETPLGSSTRAYVQDANMTLARTIPEKIWKVFFKVCACT